MRFLIRWIITAIAITVATILVPGIRVEAIGGWVAVGIMALVLGFMNAILRPILAFLSCGCNYLDHTASVLRKSSK